MAAPKPLALLGAVLAASLLGMLVLSGSAPSPARWTPSAAARRVMSADAPLQPAAAPPAAAASGKNYLVGYGSLINARSRAKTGDTGSAYPARLSGYRREWSYGQERRSMTALGARAAADAGETLNGVLVTVAHASLPKFDEREKLYRRVEVPHDRVKFLAPTAPPLAAEDKVWIYLNEKNVEPTEPLPIMQSYVDVVLEGCLRYGEEFARECVRTTHLWEDAKGKATLTWVDDRERPMIYQRGFVAPETVAKIDALLKEVVPAEFAERHPIAAAAKVSATGQKTQEAEAAKQQELVKVRTDELKPHA